MGNVIDAPYCTICKIVCEDQTKQGKFRAKHDTAPVTGLELDVGGIYGSDIETNIIVVIDQYPPSGEHKRRYEIAEIVKSDEAFINAIPISQALSGDADKSLTKHIRQLSETEFENLKPYFEKIKKAMRESYNGTAKPQLVHGKLRE